MLKSFKKLLCSKALIILALASPLYADSQVQTSKTTVNIPMRDGMTLATDIYSNCDTPKTQPTILLRTPVDRPRYEPIAQEMSSWGYNVAVQSLRSHSDAQNHPVPYVTDAWGELQDGYDTVEWLAASSYSNGNIGTYGASAMGIVQLLLAPTNPPHLKCQYIQVATPSLYHHAAYIGGKLCKHQVEGWFAKVAPDAYETILQNPEYGPYWERIDVLNKASDVKVPALHIGGWYDIFSQGTLDAYQSWQVNGGVGAKGQQKLVMGPWTHWGKMSETLGQYPIPSESLSFNDVELTQAWFDAYLKNEPEKLNQYPTVTYYVMGPLDQTSSKGNCWKTTQSWPPAATNSTYYLCKSKQLAKTQPFLSSAQYSFNYNPCEPVTTHGGRNLYLPSGPFNQELIEQREDVISFTTPTLQEDVEVTGRLNAKVFVSSKNSKMDVAISLTDVYPDGQSVLIAEGIKHLQVEPNQIIVADIDLWSTSMVFAKGHKIRVNITHSNFPHFDKNSQPAQNTLYVGKKYPSQITLPIVE